MSDERVLNGSQSSGWMPDARGLWWILPIWFVICFAATSMPFREFIAVVLDVPATKPSSQGPPFYFIYNDFVDGICTAVGLVLSLIWATLTWRRGRAASFTVVWMSLLTSTGPIATASLTWLRCDKLLTGQATCPWSTVDDYLTDCRFITILSACAMISLLVAASIITIYQLRNWKPGPGCNVPVFYRLYGRSIEIPEGSAAPRLSTGIR